MSLGSSEDYRSHYVYGKCFFFVQSIVKFVFWRKSTAHNRKTNTAPSLKLHVPHALYDSSNIAHLYDMVIRKSNITHTHTVSQNTFNFVSIRSYFYRYWFFFLSKYTCLTYMRRLCDNIYIYTRVTILVHARSNTRTNRFRINALVRFQ